MKNTLLLIIGLLVLCSPSIAQDFKPVEVFGGYQFAHAQPNANGNGWNVALTGNLIRSIGITGDFSGNYESGSSLYTYMVGPTSRCARSASRPLHMRYSEALTPTG